MLSTLTLALSVAVPLLEPSEVTFDPVAESQHDPAACTPAHDHTVCTQVGANLALVGAAAHHRSTYPLLSLSGFVPEAIPGQSALADGHPTRGPPLV